MGDKSIKRRLETIELDNPEQIRALNDSVHERIFSILDDRGACSASELARVMKLPEEEVDGYLQGLVSIGLLDEIEKEGQFLYLQVAKFFNLKKEFLSSSEGLEVFREVLVDRFAKMASQTTQLGDEIYEQGSLGFYRFKLTEEEFKEAREKIMDVLIETSKISEKSGGGSHLYQALFFMYPVTREILDGEE